jgi:predicted PurR-regulated permease PerM
MSAEIRPRAAAGSAMAAWSAKALLITAGVFLVGGAIWYARAATVPLIVAALISTQLLPLIDLATRRGMPRGLAVAASVLGVVVIGVGLAWVFTHALFGNLGGVGEDISDGADEVVAWLGDNNDWVMQHEDAIHGFLKSILPAAKDAAGGVLEGALGALSLAAQLVSGALLVLVFLLYLLTSGDAIWGWIRDRFSPDRRDRVAGVGHAAWNAASGYIRGISLIALIDTTVITLGMLVIGTPHVGTLALLSFVTLFIPILGAWVSGAVIVLVTLASVGTGAAVAMAVVILIAQQLDSMFVTPLVYQQTVNLHPIVTLTAVIVGSQLLGIVGAFLAVPMVAVAWSIYKTLEQRDRRAGLRAHTPRRNGWCSSGPDDQRGACLIPKPLI